MHRRALQRSAHRAHANKHTNTQTNDTRARARAGGIGSLEAPRMRYRDETRTRGAHPARARERVDMLRELRVPVQPTSGRVRRQTGGLPAREHACASVCVRVSACMRPCACVRVSMRPSVCVWARVWVCVPRAGAVGENAEALPAECAEHALCGLKRTTAPSDRRGDRSSRRHARGAGRQHAACSEPPCNKATYSTHDATDRMQQAASRYGRWRASASASADGTVRKKRGKCWRSDSAGLVQPYEICGMPAPQRKVPGGSFRAEVSAAPPQSSRPGALRSMRTDARRTRARQPLRAPCVHAPAPQAVRARSAPQRSATRCTDVGMSARLLRR
jgi:hypothetical protein